MAESLKGSLFLLVKNGDRNVHLKYNINQGALQEKRAIDNAVYTSCIVNIFAVVR